MGDVPTSTDGMKSGIEAAVKAAPSPAPEQVQSSLFGDIPDPDGIGDWQISEAPRGRGRPAGSKNKSTDEWTRFILSRFRSPLLGLAQISTANPHDLAKEFNIKPAAALAISMQAMRDLAPYLHQKQPLAVTADGLAMMQIIIGDIGDADMADLPVIQPIENNEQNQSLSVEQSDVSESDGRKE